VASSGFFKRPGLPGQVGAASVPSMPDTSKAPDSRPEAPPESKPAKAVPPKEIGGPKGPEPTRYGDWERDGRVSDF
jgi:hypothetical protein